MNADWSWFLGFCGVGVLYLAAGWFGAWIIDRWPARDEEPPRHARHTRRR
jgi:hypothetical protein